MDIDLDEPSDTGFDIGSSMDKIADGLGLRGASGSLPPDDSSEAEAVHSDAAVVSDTDDTDTDDADLSSTDPEAAALSLTSRPPPKSWSHDKHELWSKLPPDAQEYYEVREKQFLDGLDQYKGEATYGKAMRDVLSPYKPILAAQGIDEPQAVQYLMNAHYRLTQGTVDQRMAAYRKLGQDLRLLDGATAAEPESPVDPQVRQLQERLNGIESSLTARQEAELKQSRERAAAEVNAFASDKANPYFDEVVDDILPMIQAGHSLKDAYDKAVWANPITRQKEIARIQTEAEAKLKLSANKEAEAAKRATSANVRGRETRRAPTEPKGTMEETMRDTLERIKNRAH